MNKVWTEIFKLNKISPDFCWLLSSLRTGDPLLPGLSLGFPNLFSQEPVKTITLRTLRDIAEDGPADVLVDKLGMPRRLFTNSVSALAKDKRATWIDPAEFSFGGRRAFEEIILLGQEYVILETSGGQSGECVSLVPAQCIDMTT